MPSTTTTTKTTKRARATGKSKPRRAAKKKNAEVNYEDLSADELHLLAWQMTYDAHHPPGDGGEPRNK